MKDREEPEGLDPRFHNYLDGELSPSDAAAFEEELRSDDVLRNRLSAMRGINDWFQATRSRAPSTLLPRVESALDDPRSTPLRALEGAGSTGGGPSRRRRLPLALGLAAAAAVVILFALPVLRGPVSMDPGVDPADVASIPEETIAPVADPGSRASDAGGNTVRFTFQFRAAEAATVCLAGDFNSWKVCETPLQRVGEDLWSVSVELPRGRHEYMFVVDGRWMPDPDASILMDDGFGNKNAVLSL